MVRKGIHTYKQHVVSKEQRAGEDVSGWICRGGAVSMLTRCAPAVCPSLLVR
jgi:hypothetical protein